MKGQGLVEYALILVLVAIVVIAAITLVSNSSIGDNYGTVVCQDNHYTGTVDSLSNSDAYIVTLESGRKVKAPKAVCIFEER